MKQKSIHFLSSGHWGNILESELQLEILKHLLSHRKSAKIRVVIIAFIGTLLSLSGFFFQKRFVDSLVSDTHLSWHPAWWILGAFCALFFSHLCSLACKGLCLRESNLAQNALAMALYQKTLQLDPKARQGKTTGQLVSLFAQDVIASTAILDDTLPNIITAIVPLVMAPIVVSFFVDVSVVLPFLTATVVIFVCVLLSVRQGRFFTQAKLESERRLSFVNEWLQNMRALKTLGWTSNLEDQIFEARRAETQNRLSMVTNGSSMNSIAQVAPYLVNLAGIISFLWLTKTSLSPGDLFSLFWVFGVFLVRPIRMFPWTLVIAKDASTSAQRLQEFFKLPSLANEINHKLLLDDSSPAFLDIIDLQIPVSPEVTIKVPQFKMRHGHMVALVGPVGAGKSIFLKAILGEMSCSAKRFDLKGFESQAPKRGKCILDQICYVPQDSFLMSATLADNILLKYTQDQSEAARLEDCLRVCHFVPTVEGLKQGLETNLGERGVNLSGGQRQRVALARAVASDRQNILLDDCFDALDIHTEKAILNDLLLSEWAGRTILIATHRMTLLQHCNNILFFHDNALHDQGSLTDLLGQSQKFRQFFENECKLSDENKDTII